MSKELQALERIEKKLDAIAEFTGFNKIVERAVYDKKSTDQRRQEIRTKLQKSSNK